MSTLITSAATDQATDGNGELTTTPWQDVHHKQTTGRATSLALIASDDKAAGDRFRSAADTEGRPA